MDYEDIITALKNGTVPANGASEICIGRENEINEFKYLLSKIRENKAYTKFIDGEFGAGKSFFLKVIEEVAFEENFVVAKVTLSRDVPFNKIEIVYRNIVKNLRCKTGTSLEHIIERWITKLKMMAFDETSDPVKQNLIINENIHNDLENARKHSNPFVVAIENYNKAMNSGEYETAKYAQAWLRGDSNIPYTEKRKFGVKGDVDRENAFKLLEALSAFLKTIGYSGLVILIDEAEYIMMLQSKKLRDTAYNYIRDIYDECNSGNFQNTMFIFAGTPRFFDDDKIGVPSYEALNDRIEDALDTSLKDLRKPILKLEGFTKDELIEMAKKLVLMHENVYKWNGSEKIEPVMENIVDVHEENAGLTGGRVTPRIFVRSFMSVLDTIQQNPDEFNEDKDILKVFEEKETELEEALDDDW